MITVVCCVYNMEKYMDKCIQSLINQTFSDWELILVDDGSVDESGKKCDEWGQKDDRIRVIHKGNGGLSSARNCGIENAKGEYIIFPDPDDYVEADYLEKLLKIREDNNADLSICGHFCSSMIMNRNGKLQVMDKRTALKILLNPDYYCGYAWNKLYSVKVIRDNRLLFDTELGAVQDLHFNVRYIRLCERIAYDPVALYHYSLDTGGVSTIKTTLTPRKMSAVLTYKKIAGLFEGIDSELEDVAYSSLCKVCLDYIIVYYTHRMKSKEILDILRENAVKYRKEFLHCETYARHYRRCASLV
ncbi:MAG: glycosyltransferase, partial [Lachnospiraceae bacterium]|nr:glycosyltransferase [Lachnospiraceae bacterium]